MRSSAGWMLILCLWASVIGDFTEAHEGQQTMYWCASFDCTDPISEGKTNLNYQAPNRDQLTFGRNQEVTILSKPIDASKGHWIARIRGKVGMIPVNMVKETKMYGKIENGYKFPLDVHPLQPKPKPVNVESEQVEVDPKLETIDGTLVQATESSSPVVSPNEISPTSANLVTSESVLEVLLQPSQAMDEKPTDDAQDPKSEETSHLLSSQPVTPVLTDNPSVVFTSEKTDIPLDEDSSSKSAATIEATPPVPASKENTEATEAPVINLHPSPSPFSEVYDSIQTFFGASSPEEVPENGEASAQSHGHEEHSHADGDHQHQNDNEERKLPEKEVSSFTKEDTVHDPIDTPGEGVPVEQSDSTPKPDLADASSGDETKENGAASVESVGHSQDKEEHALGPDEEHTHAHEDHSHAQDDHSHAHDDHSHAHDDHSHAHGDHSHAHDDHSHAHDDHSHAHDDHSHAHDDHSHAHNDHSNAHDERSHAPEELPVNEVPSLATEVPFHDPMEIQEKGASVEQSEIPPKADLAGATSPDEEKKNDESPSQSASSSHGYENHSHGNEDNVFHHDHIRDEKMKLPENEVASVATEDPVQGPIDAQEETPPVDQSVLTPDAHLVGASSTDKVQEDRETPTQSTDHSHGHDKHSHGHDDHSHGHDEHSHGHDEHSNGHDEHSHGPDEHSRVHHDEEVKLTEDEVPSFAGEDPVQDPIDTQEKTPPVEQSDSTPKPDLVGRHQHLNPLLHPHLHDHDHEHQGQEGHHHHHKQPKPAAETSSFVLVGQYLSSTLINFLPEYLQDTIYDVNNALVFTGIIALTLVSICVPYFFIETFLSVRPLKKKVTELNKNLWKVSTAYENQQEEYDVFKKKALAYDEDKKRIEQLEVELHLIKKLESKQKEQIRQFQKEIKASNKVAKEVESLVETTMDERNKAVEERDKLKAVVVSLQSSLKETTEELESAQADAATTQMDLDLITHTKENLDLKVKAIEKEMLELKQKVLSEVELRRSLQLEKDKLAEEKDSAQEELSDLKEILHKYEETVNDLNQELSLKENELSALKETLGDDSPLIDIAEMTARLQVAESQAKSLQSRVESITLENTSLNRNYEQTKNTVKTLQAEKDQAETRLQVLESYFKEKEEELRTIVEKYEVEKNIRGKDKDELVSMIEEKNDEVKDLSSRLEKLKQEFEQTKLAHRNEIRALEAKSHENWLALCQSERKAQDVRKESELLRQKLTAIVKEKEAESNDARSSNGDVLAPFLFSQLELDEIPVPITDESSLPSYFGLGEGFYGLGDFEPPAPLDDDDEEDGDDTLNSIQRREREPHRPPPLGRISPTFSDNEPDMSPIVMSRGGREDYSDGSSSPLHNRPTSRGNWVNGNGSQSQSTPTRRRGPQTSSPIQHGLNL